VAKDFVRRKFAWLDQVAADFDVSAAAFRLAYRIASEHLNSETFEAFPSQSTLAALVGIGSAKGVRYLVDQLVAGGHLTVIAAHGRGRMNTYRPVIKSERLEPAAESSDDKTEACLFPELKRLPENTNGIKAASAAADAGAGLVEEFKQGWWPQFPRHVGKAKAEQIYVRVRRAGTSADVLLAGAMRYSAERSGKDPEYTKHPSTWLNGRCWEDEQLPPRPESAYSADPRARGPRSHVEIALGGLKRE
jgi:hypothetical protein